MPEKARTAALNNDMATVSEEIANNQEILSAFSSGNRIQQDAIAKSLGMSKDQVAKMIVLQKINKGMTDEQAAAIAYKQQLKNWNLVPWTYRLSEQWRIYSDSTTVASRKKIRKDKYKNQFWFVPNF